MRFEMNYCPRCGYELVDQEAFGRMRRVCPACGFVFFRDPKVAVSVLLEKRGEVLLVRRAVIPRIGYWALPAGYMEWDEEPRQAALREVAEETGLEVELTGLLDVFPINNPNARGALIVFRGRPIGGTPAPTDDVSEVRWFSAKEIPWDELAFDSTRQVLQQWRTHCCKQLTTSNE